MSPLIPITEAVCVFCVLHFERYKNECLERELTELICRTDGISEKLSGVKIKDNNCK